MIATDGFIPLEPRPGVVEARAAGSGSGSLSSGVLNLSSADWQVGDYLFIAVDQDGASPSITGGSGSGWTLNTVVDVGGTKKHVLHKKLVMADLTTLTVNGTGARPVGYRSYRNVLSVALLQSVASAANAPSLDFTTIIPNVYSSMLLANLSQGAGAFISPATNWGGGGFRPNLGVFYDLSTITYPAPGAPSFAVGATDPSGQTGQLYELIGNPL